MTWSRLSHRRVLGGAVFWCLVGTGCFQADSTLVDTDDPNDSDGASSTGGSSPGTGDGKSDATTDDSSTTGADPTVGDCGGLWGQSNWDDACWQ